MRALRDFNIPKIVTDDVPVFMGLIGDLFPALDVPRKRDMDFEALVKKSALVRINWPEEAVSHKFCRVGLSVLALCLIPIDFLWEKLDNPLRLRPQFSTSFFWKHLWSEYGVVC